MLLQAFASTTVECRPLPLDAAPSLFLDSNSFMEDCWLFNKDGDEKTPQLEANKNILFFFFFSFHMEKSWRGAISMENLVDCLVYRLSEEGKVLRKPCGVRVIPKKEAEM